MNKSHTQASRAPDPDFAVLRAVSAARDVNAATERGAPTYAARAAAFNSLGLSAQTVDTIERELVRQEREGTLIVDVPEYRRALGEFDDMRRGRVRTARWQAPRFVRIHRARQLGRSA